MIWDEVNRKDLFLLVQDAFLQDFSFIDVKDHMLTSHVFTEEECQAILSEPEFNQIGRMFFLLTYNEQKSLKDFKEGLMRDYSWLAYELEDKIRSTKDHPKLEPYRDCINHGWIPGNRNVFVYRCDFLWNLIQKLHSLSRQKYLIIRGNLGYGKSWLAIDACLDYSVIRAMDFHVYWLNVSKCDTPEAILERMQFLKIMVDNGRTCDNFRLTDFESIELKIIGLKKFFQNLFQHDKYKNALLVLCNVKNKTVLEAFDFNSKILATTRNESCFDDIPSKQKEFVVLEKGLTEDESLEFFSKLGCPDSSKQLVRAIHGLCKGDPMIMSLISNNMTSHKNKEIRLRKFLDELKRKELNDRQLHPMIEESLRSLPENEIIAYQQLVVFPEYSYVPSSVIQQYWDKKDLETEDLVSKFYRCSLLAVNYFEKDIPYISMHYLYRSYLLTLYSEGEKRELHCNLIKSYQIENALNRPEPDLIDLPNDKYIHYYIGYHLKEAQYLNLFPKLFLDFGFLEQKLRYTGLANTIGDLTIYRQDICNEDPTRYRLLDELLHFLPTIEEMIYQTNDTSLLQYCLTSTNRIAEEATRQAAQFPNRVWFSDIDHAHKRRQIVQLHGKPVHFNFHDPDAIVVALDDHSILLTDLSPSYFVEPTLYQGHNSKIKHMSTFNNYILSLDNEGIILIWSLRDTPIQIYRNEDKPNKNHLKGNQYDRVAQNYDVRNINYRKAIQKIDSEPNPIACYKLYESKSVIKLFCADKKGRISSYEWNVNTEKFNSSSLKFHSKVENIQCLHFIPNTYLMTLTQEGHISFFDLISHSKMAFTQEWTVTKHPIAIYQNSSDLNLIYCVFKEKIVKFKISKFVQKVILMDPFQVIYSTESHKDAKIKCSAFSDDGKYLILGTRKGIIVIDCMNEVKVLRNSIGDKISCIDICTCGDDIYKYILISGAENGQNVGNIYGLKVVKKDYDLITWASCKMSFSDENLALGLGTDQSWLIGGPLFDIVENNSELTVYGVDSLNRVQYFSKENQYSTCTKVSEIYPEQIKVTSTWKDDFYIGCADGKIFKFGQSKPVAELRSSINFMKELNDVLIVSTPLCFQILTNEVFEYDGSVLDCFSLSDHIILIVLKNGLVHEVDLYSRSIYPQIKQSDKLITGCDLKGNYLALVFSSEVVRIHPIDTNNRQVNDSCISEIVIRENHITAIALSDDGFILAVGMENGEIEIYKTMEGKRLQTLASHVKSINQLIFSPWPAEDTNQPLILISLSEQICFWNIKYVVNNPIDSLKPRKRSSQRFSKELKSPVDVIASGFENLLTLNGKNYTPCNYWEEKIGPSDKPELLSCIKFIGNNAERLRFNRARFDHFVTIDDEGNIYILSTKDLKLNKLHFPIPIS